MKISNNSGCSMSIYIDVNEKTIYLADFNSIYQSMGNFESFLRNEIEILRVNYPTYLIYADCNPAGTGVSIKAGGRIVEILTRIKF